MRLKRLQVHGFKSFADRTEFDLSAGGLTCIVGPNGCGKSNVFDAVKWILGEQRPTSLRGKEMADVIFNGTVRRPPMGLCEGTLHFDNTCRTLALESDEVAVTRRVYRTGETEYLINNRPVRLKDVRDLFAGTGLGAGGYAFMEQGKIDSVLAVNPLERRKVFEEAAGISRFRARKHETELKLAKFEENLTRLADVVEEINRQIRSLKIHAGKARSHREMTGRLRDLGERYSRHRYRAIREEQRMLESELERITAARADKAQEREALREALREVEVELEALLHSVAEARTRQAEIAGQIDTCQEKIAFHEHYAEELAGRLQHEHGEIERLERSSEAQREELVVLAREQEELEHDSRRLAALRESDERRVQELRQEGATLAQERTRAEQAVADLERRRADVANREARLEADIRHLEARIEGLRAQRGELDREREEHCRRLDERSGHKDEQASVLESGRHALADAERIAESAEVVHGLAVDHARQVESDLGRLEARSEVLQGLLRAHEGLDEGARAILEEKERNPSFLPGLRGLLLELFEVDLEHARAVDAALGEAAAALVVETAAEALEGLRHLRASGLGRALFLPLERFAGQELLPIDGIRPRDAGVARILSALLGGIEIVTEAELERRLLDGTDRAPLLVSAEGEVLREGRALARPRGGHGAPGLVVLRSELKDLERRLPALREGLDQARGTVRERREAVDAARARVKEQSVALVRAESEAERLDQEILRLVRELERLNAGGERLLCEEQNAVTHRDAARTRLEGEVQTSKELEAAKAARLHDLEHQRAKLAEHAEELDRALAALESLRIDEAKAVERLHATQARGEALRAALEEAGRRLEGGRARVIDLERAREQTAGVLDEQRTRRESLDEERARALEIVEQRESSADKVRDGLKEVAERLDRVEAELAVENERLARARGREGELRAGLENLVERTRDELGIDLGEQVLEEPEASPEGEAPDWKAVEGEIKELRDRITRLGNVNLAAVEELEEAEKRAEFIAKERKDLEDSREQLRKVLRTIETQSTTMFLETFNAVREHFAVIFRKLFGGGKAEIVLENPEAPLESGIEIRARPPGKELRSISLLSGGERSMTAVALLFAIFKAHPTPCAFLDEVDAALDEDNTERFVRMVEDARGESQFIVVTHSKRTMERADLLYGVTMPERGVSRRVAVRLEQVDEQGRIKDVEALNREASREAHEAADAVITTETRPAESGKPVRTRSLEALAFAHRARPEPEAPHAADQDATG